MRLCFDHRKATQTLNYFAEKVGGPINKMKALKLVFLADRYHLRQYGRPITNDEYLAMEYGPVPSGCKDLAEKSEFLGAHERKYAEQFLKPVDEHDFESFQDVQKEVFSKTDLEALHFTWSNFGGYDQFRLAEVTHSYPEWKRHEVALQSEDVSRLQMSYRDFLQNPPRGFDPAPRLSVEDRKLREEDIDELAAIESLWR